MKEKIHPKYEKAQVRCACGETFETRSTRPNLRVDICSKCHPFYTGKRQMVDVGGRVDRFNRRFNRGGAEK
ncbi:MAG: 50S ribosomal protein L31 [Oscillospiraceae bacterium]|nr:50S ribosomal protein L31 [Oscillospiraceae bacterium]